MASDMRTRIGILGGGQLGKMLAQAASRWNLDLRFLDKDPTFPVAKVTNQLHFGSFRDYEAVYQFGRDLDVISIEIENVNVEALAKLEAEGKKVFPPSRVISIIKDKGWQKRFYTEHNLPTSGYTRYDSPEQIKRDVKSGNLRTPFVQKACTEGYDGRGVQIVRQDEDLEELLMVKSVVEELVQIEKEIAVMVARNPSGEIAVYPAVEMAFHPTANLVEELISPARIPADIEKDAQDLATRTILALDMVGILAVEMFYTKDGLLLINESAPRPHNSGHHTIEASTTSQYEQLLRCLLDLPLGNTRLTSPAVMVNILGAPDHIGPAIYRGIDPALALDNVHVHLYGKTETKPCRKMGHVTVLDDDLEVALEKAREVKKLIEVVAQVGKPNNQQE